jgi:hypothetical protein
MSVLGACWHRPILGKIKEVLKELKKRRKKGSAWKKRKRSGNKGKLLPLESGQEVGKWTSADLEQWLDRGPTEMKSRRKWTNLILLGLGFL